MRFFGAPGYRSPGTVTVEGDWSNGAFWVAAQMLGSPVAVRGLNAISIQGDRAVVDISHQLQEPCLLKRKRRGPSQVSGAGCLVYEPAGEGPEQQQTQVAVF